MNDFLFLINGKEVSSSVSMIDDKQEVTIGGNKYILTAIDENKFEIEFGGNKISGIIAYSKGKYFVEIESHQFEIENADELSFASVASSLSGEKDKIFAPMPGKIVKLMVKVGDSVEENMPVLIVEAMKMENQVVALANGVVTAVNFAVGDQVDTIAPIIEIELENE